jgi:hypothetical protein
VLLHAACFENDIYEKSDLVHLNFCALFYVKRNKKGGVLMLLIAQLGTDMNID